MKMLRSHVSSTLAICLATISLAMPAKSFAKTTGTSPVLLPDVPVYDSGKQVVINIPQLRLFLYEDGSFVKSFPVAVGKRRTQTPLGEFSITGKSYNPTWHIPLSIQRERGDSVKSVPPGPRNPLGPVFVRIGHPRMAIGIHGTNAPSSVPGVRSHGCVRMHSKDALKFAEFIDVESPVRIIHQRYALNQDANGNLWLAIYPNHYGKSAGEAQSIEQSVGNWLSNNPGKSLINEDGFEKMLSKAKLSPVCLTCDDESPSGALTPLAWTQGTGDVRSALLSSTEHEAGGSDNDFDLRYTGETRKIGSNSGRGYASRRTGEARTHDMYSPYDDMIGEPVSSGSGNSPSSLGSIGEGSKKRATGNLNDPMPAMEDSPVITVDVGDADEIGDLGGLGSPKPARAVVNTGNARNRSGGANRSATPRRDPVMDLNPEPVGMGSGTVHMGSSDGRAPSGNRRQGSPARSSMGGNLGSMGAGTGDPYYQPNQNQGLTDESNGGIY